MTYPHLSAESLVRTYPAPRGGRVKALNDLSFDLVRGKTLGIVGSSGAGKSTLVRLLLGLEEPDSGQILIDGQDIAVGGPAQRRRMRMKMQVVFQDPRSSLNPHLSLHSILEEPLLARRGTARKERRHRVETALNTVGLDASMQNRRPGELSGGERQRVAIARALICEPEILILDEPVSALDGPIRAQILELLAQIKADHDLTIVMVSHDIRSTRVLADSVMVVYAGACVESGPAELILDTPSHPFTQALIAAVPEAGATWSIPDTIVDAEPADTGCSSRLWCPLATPECETAQDLHDITPGHEVACWK
jgi:oligopeptide/dipeptide ABC transporter ATP-binding protein